MTDELTVETDQQPAESPAVDEAAIAAYLGVELDYLPEVQKNAKNAQALIKKAQQEKSLTARERAELEQKLAEIEAQQAAASKPERPKLDPEAESILRDYIEEALAPVKQAQQAARDAEVNGIIAAFEAEHPEADLGEIGAFMEEYDIAPNSPAKLQKALNHAYKTLYDNPEQRIRAELEAKKGKDGEVVEITQKSKSAQPELNIWERKDLTVKEIAAMLAAKRS